MGCRQLVAGVATTALVMGGLVATGGAAMAEPVETAATEYAPLASFAKPTTQRQQDEVYNTWHFDKDHRATTAEQARNGIRIKQGSDTLALRGTGMDSAYYDEGDAPNESDIRELAESLRLTASDASALTYQVPVFYEKTEGQSDSGFTTLYRAADGTDDRWTTSQAIGEAFLKGATATLEELTDALEEYDNARPIAAGYLAYHPTRDVVVTSFTADGVTTRFTEEPEAAAAGDERRAYVSAAHIREDEDVYPGWHNGDTSGRSFRTVASEVDGETLGLEVTGKTQILNGLDDADFQTNAAGFARDMRIDATGDVWSQVAVNAYPDGAADRVFTTLRALVPESGNLADATSWVSSRDLPGISKNTNTELDALLAALGEHDVIGYGAFVDTGKTATIRSISFNGATTDFAKSVTPSAETVYVSDIVNTTNKTEENEHYNVWHYDPDHQGDAVVETRAGIEIPADDDVLVLKGNGLNGDAATSWDDRDIADLAKSLDIDAEGDTGALYYQVPVFYEAIEGRTSFTTLRKAVDSDADEWTTSAKIPATATEPVFAKNATGTLAELTEALERFDNARPIGAGVLAYHPESTTTISSFTAAGEITTFTAKPEVKPEPDPATTRGTASVSGTAVYNSAKAIKVKVSGTFEGAKASGTAKVTIAGKTYKDVRIANGAGSFKLAKAVPAGKQDVTVAFTPDDKTRFTSSTHTTKIAFAKATPRVSAKLVKSKVTTKQQAKVSVAVTVPGSLKAKASKTKVAVFDGKKKLKTVTLSTSGKATVALPKLKAGTHKIRVQVVSDKNLTSKKSTTRTLKVVKKK